MYHMLWIEEIKEVLSAIGVDNKDYYVGNHFILQTQKSDNGQVMIETQGNIVAVGVWYEGILLQKLVCWFRILCVLSL